MGLAGWNSNQKLKLTIDNSKVDGDLTDFPVLITLSSGSGQTGFDATGVFDELTTASGSYVNRKKIAVTTTISGVETELYVEIETWDDTTSSGNEQAWLWTKVPTIASGTNTDLYLYYDSAHTTNSGYVGDTGETPAQAVWDEYFKSVLHMAQDPSGGAGCILDSTDNTNNGTPAGSMTSEDLVDGKVGKAIDFDGNDDYIQLPAIQNSISAYTVEALIKTSDNMGPILQSRGTGAGLSLTFDLGNRVANKACFMLDSDIILRGQAGDTSINDNVYHNVVGTFFRESGDVTTSDFNIFVDGEGESLTAQSASNTSSVPLTSSFNTLVGYHQPWAYYLGGQICSIRVSDTLRSESWIKATYYSNWDDLITYNLALTFIFTNPIPVHLSTVYGTSHTLQLTTTVSGGAPSYVYDAVFYDALDDSQIGSTASGVSSGQAASTTMQTPSGIDYNWYVTATSSGVSDTSSTYNFTNRFLCSGTTEVNNVLTADIPVRLYRRSTGELIGSTASISGGLFEIESTYNENHYAIAIHPTDSGTNALVYDWLIP